MSPRNQQLREVVVLAPAGRSLRDRLVYATATAALAAGIVVVVFSHDDLPDLDPARPPAVVVNGPVAADGARPYVDLDPTTTTTTAPPTTSATPTTAPPATTTSPPNTAAPAGQGTGAPSGAKASPEEAARAWFAHRLDIPARQVTVLQRDRRSRDAFRVLVTAPKGHRQQTALLKVARVAGNHWRTTGLWEGR